MEDKVRNPIKNREKEDKSKGIEDLYFKAEEIFNDLKSYSQFHGLNFFTSSDSKCIQDLTYLLK